MKSKRKESLKQGIRGQERWMNLIGVVFLVTVMVAPFKPWYFITALVLLALMFGISKHIDDLRRT